MKQNYTRLLDRNYIIAAHLIERLEELSSGSHFQSLKGDIRKALELLEAELLHFDQLFQTFGKVPNFEANLQLIAFLEETFSHVNNKDSGNSYESLLDYIVVADALMAGSAKQTEGLFDGDEYDPDSHCLYQTVTLQSLINAIVQIGHVSVK